jgi:hypothetical protein
MIKTTLPILVVFPAKAGIYPGMGTGLRRCDEKFGALYEGKAN